MEPLRRYGSWQKLQPFMSQAPQPGHSCVQETQALPSQKRPVSQTVHPMLVQLRQLAHADPHSKQVVMLSSKGGLQLEQPEDVQF